jgi:hypothetical protein
MSGTGLPGALESEQRAAEIVAIARRGAAIIPANGFVAADVVTAELIELMRGADAVGHLAWLIQPGRDEALTHAVNLAGHEKRSPDPKDLTSRLQVLPALCAIPTAEVYDPLRRRDRRRGSAARRARRGGRDVGAGARVRCTSSGRAR